MLNIVKIIRDVRQLYEISDTDGVFSLLPEAYKAGQLTLQYQHSDIELVKYSFFEDISK